MVEEEITAEQNNSSDDVQSTDCISVLSRNGSADILGTCPTANSKINSQDSDNMHNLKTSATENHQEDLASNGIIEETSHPVSSIDMAEQQASSSVSANKIDAACLMISRRPILLLKRVYLQYQTSQVDV
jgi:hypothetical protein